MSGRVLEKLLQIGFCGGKWSEKACYDIAEIVFGFDDSNSNMVSMELFSFLITVEKLRQTMRCKTALSVVTSS